MASTLSARSESGERVVMYPGSFDPITLGHLDVVQRGRKLFDRVVVAIGRNPGKANLFTPEERLEMSRRLIGEMVEQDPHGASVDVLTFEGLTVDFAHTVNASAIMRGIRSLSDLQNEVQQAVTNREVAGLETVFIVADQHYAYTSSSLIKQIAALGDDLEALRSMCPDLVIQKLQSKKDSNDPLLRQLRDAT